jgi:hypothetical protein
MENNGGYATLGYLYQNVNVKDWKTKTPFATIRRIVQDSRFFFRIRPGLWALNDYREKVLGKFYLSTGENKQENLFNHTYYQGLIVEIGNLKNFETHVPNQDKNKLFLERPLKKVSSLQNIYEFSYPTIVKRASTIDVIWFNHRKLPYAFLRLSIQLIFKIHWVNMQIYKISILNFSWFVRLKRSENLRTLLKLISLRKLKIESNS